LTEAEAGPRLLDTEGREPGPRVAETGARETGFRPVAAECRDPGLWVVGAEGREPGLRVAEGEGRESGLRVAEGEGWEPGFRAVEMVVPEAGLPVVEGEDCEPDLRATDAGPREAALRVAEPDGREPSLRLVDVGLRVVETDGREPGLRLVGVGLRVVEPDGRDPAACVRGPRLPPPGRGADRPVAGFEAGGETLFRAGAGAAPGREREKDALPVPRAPAAGERDGAPVAAFGVDVRDASARRPAPPPLACLAAGREAAARERSSPGGEEGDLGAADAFGAGEWTRGVAARDAGEEPLRDRGVAAFSATVRRCGPVRLVAAGLELDGAVGRVLRGAASPRDPFFLAPVVFVGIMPPSHPGLGTGPLTRSGRRCAPQGSNGRGSPRCRALGRQPNRSGDQPGGSCSSASS
jgi:hypothetical protein